MSRRVKYVGVRGALGGGNSAVGFNCGREELKMGVVEGEGYQGTLERRLERVVEAGATHTQTQVTIGAKIWEATATASIQFPCRATITRRAHGKVPLIETTSPFGAFIDAPNCFYPIVHGVRSCAGKLKRLAAIPRRQISTMLSNPASRREG